MQTRHFRLFLDDLTGMDFQRAMVNEAKRLAEAVGEAINCRLEVIVTEAHGSHELQRKQVAELGMELPFDSDDIVGLMPVNFDGVTDLLDALDVPGHDASSNHQRQIRRQKLTCVVLHQILPYSMVEPPGTHWRRLYSVTANQLEMGRLQAEQILRLLSRRQGTECNFLYITGPEYSSATQLRIAGAVEALLKNDVNVLARHADWSGNDADEVIASWLADGGQLEDLDVVAAHSDGIARGLRKSLIARGSNDIPVLGMDGTDILGVPLVRGQELCATVVQPLGIEEVFEIYQALVLEKMRPEDLSSGRDFRLRPFSFPPIEDLEPLAPRRARKTELVAASSTGIAQFQKAAEVGGNAHDRIADIAICGDGREVAGNESVDDQEEQFATRSIEDVSNHSDSPATIDTLEVGSDQAYLNAWFDGQSSTELCVGAARELCLTVGAMEARNLLGTTEAEISDLSCLSVGDEFEFSVQCPGCKVRLIQSKYVYGSNSPARFEITPSERAIGVGALTIIVLRDDAVLHVVELQVKVVAPVEIEEAP